MTTVTLPGDSTQRDPGDPIRAIIPTAVTLALAVADYDSDLIDQLLPSLAVRELHALAIVLAAHVNLDRPITASLPCPATPERLVIRAVNLAAEMFGVTADSILGEGRKRPVLDARAVAMAALRLCGSSSPSIGVAFSRDHSTVLYAASRVGEDRRLRGLARRVAEQCGWDRDAQDGVA